MVCNIHYLYNKHLRRHAHEKHCQPLQTMLRPLNAYTHMHVTSPPDNYQIPPTIHAQQTKIGKLSTTNTSHLNKYKQQNSKGAPYNMLRKPTQIAHIKAQPNPPVSPMIIKPNTCCNESRLRPHIIPTLEIHNIDKHNL